MTEQGKAPSASVYVYGIVRADGMPDTLGGGDSELPEVHLVEEGDIAALVSTGPERATRELVLGHGRVLEAALDHSPVVPLRFGMLVTDEDAVRREVLEAHHDDLVRLLDRFEDRVQVTLKVYYHEDAVVAEILAANPQLAKLHEAVRGGSEDATYKQRVKLGEAINAAMEKRRTRDGAEILEPLKSRAEAVSLEPPEDELMVAHVAFLLPRERFKEFDSAVEDIAKDRVELLRFRLLGPMPAYNFVDFREPAWA
jgi:Gas vesicle synthesis protein GvpL/GvpF